MASTHWIEQPKSVADALNDTNCRVEFVYENGKMTECLIKVLPLSTNIVYRVKSEAMLNLLFELETN